MFAHPPLTSSAASQLLSLTLIIDFRKWAKSWGGKLVKYKYVVSKDRVLRFHSTTLCSTVEIASSECHILADAIMVHNLVNVETTASVLLLRLLIQRAAFRLKNCELFTWKLLSCSLETELSKELHINLKVKLMLVVCTSFTSVVKSHLWGALSESSVKIAATSEAVWTCPRR